MGVETKFCHRPPVGCWWITQSQPETVTTVGKFWGKRTNWGTRSPELPLPAPLGGSAERRLPSVPRYWVLRAPRRWISTTMGMVWKQLVIMETWDGVSGAACRQPGCTPKSSPIHQWGHHLSIPVPSCDTREGVLTARTQRCRRRHPQGSAGPTSTGSCDSAARHQAGGVGTCLQPPR